MTRSFKCDSVVQSRDCVGETPGAIGIEELSSYYLGVPINSDDASSVIAARRDNSRDVGSVPVVIQGISCSRYRVDPVVIVHETVAVVIESVSWSFPRIAPHVCVEIGVVVINSGVDHENERPIIRSACGVIPRRGQVHICDRPLEARV